MDKDMDIKTFTTKNYAIVCREYSKISPDVSAYEIPVEEISGVLLQCLSLRSRLNPELAYFVTKRENLQTCLNILKSKFKSEITIEDGIMVQI